MNLVRAKGSTEQSIVFTVLWQGPLSDSEGTVESKGIDVGCTAEESWHSMCFRRLSRWRYSMYGVLEGSAKQSMLYTVFLKAHPSKNMVFIYARRLSRAEYGIYRVFVFCEAQPDKIWYSLCLERLSRAKYVIDNVFGRSAKQEHGIYCVFECSA